MTRLSLRSTRLLLAAAALLAPSLGSAQSAARQSRFEARPFVGAYIPTGDHRDLLESGVLAGVQGAVRLGRFASLVGTVSYASTADKTLAMDEGVDLWQYDLGVEAHATRAFANGVELTPFVGAGAGGRSYNYRDLEQDAQNRFAGYGALGVALQRGALGLRLEARDYLSSFTGLRGEFAESKTRNDVSLGAALTIRF